MIQHPSLSHFSPTVASKALKQFLNTILFKPLGELKRAYNSITDYTYRIGQFLIECSETKTKVISLTNHKGCRQFSEPMKV